MKITMTCASCKRSMRICNITSVAEGVIFRIERRCPGCGDEMGAHFQEHDGDIRNVFNGDGAHDLFKRIMEPEGD